MDQHGAENGGMTPFLLYSIFAAIIQPTPFPFTKKNNEKKQWAKEEEEVLLETSTEQHLVFQ